MTAAHIAVDPHNLFWSGRHLMLRCVKKAKWKKLTLPPQFRQRLSLGKDKFRTCGHAFC